MSSTFAPPAFHPPTKAMLPKESERSRWSDYVAWPEGERNELIDGIAYAMSLAS